MHREMPILNSALVQYNVGERAFLNCPRCGGPVSAPPEREWTFQSYKVSRFRCDKGDKFNLYKGRQDLYHP